jgi:hypothetical protein
MLAQMPIKSQKFVYSKIDFDHKAPSEVFHDIVDAMQQVSRNKTQVAVLNVYAKMSLSDKDILDAFGDRQQKTPLTFTDDQIDYIRQHVYRNRDGKFRLIPMTKNCSADMLPLDGLEADERIIGAKLSNIRINEIGGTEKFDGLSVLEELPYEPPYDGVWKQLAPNLQRINIVSSFQDNDPFGFFVKDNKMYRNVCAQMTKVDQSLVNDISLRRAMLLLFIVSGGRIEEWHQLYKVIHFMVRCPDSATGIILYLNDFDAGGNGKSKLVSVLQTMFGDTFTAFAPQQLRFTMSLMGKRLVSISEFEANGMNDQLQGIMKSMTGRDRFQYEGKGIDPVVADTYQNFVISSNKYIYFEDSGIKRRLQNFHCSNLLHAILTRFSHSQAYLNKFFGNLFDGSARRIKDEMAHSLLDFILKDDSFEPLNIKPQQIVLGALRNPVLRALFSTKMQPDAFIASVGDGSRIDLYRLYAEAKPEQLNYAASTVQAWFSDISFDVARDASYMECDVPEPIMIKQFTDRLNELDAVSRKLKSKTGIALECGELRGFKSAELVKEFLGDAFNTYSIPVHQSEDVLVVG